jgi:UDP-N-acetylmuramate dehydrogenase
MNIQEHVALAPATTFKVAAESLYFCEAKSLENLKEALLFAKSKDIPFFVLGGGSNTLFSKDYAGLVIRIAIKSTIFKEGADVEAQVGAGENWDEFVRTCVEKGYWGVENLSLIPGSVGGAVVQNIGAYGVEFNQVVESVEVFDTELCELKTLSNAECKFSYRTSIFKTDAGKKYIVTGATFRLKKNSEPNLSYKDVADYFNEKNIKPTLPLMREAVIEIRQRKLPDVKEVGTAGSFFKNPIVEKLKYTQLQSRFPGIKGTLISDGLVKISAAWMLDNIGGYKGVRRGEIGVWPKHALVLVNYGSARGEEVLALANEMTEKIKSETEIELEKEVVIV